MSLRNTQKPLRSLLSGKETASTIVAVPAGVQTTSVITATYDSGLTTPLISNKAGSVGVLSPFDGSLQQSVTATETVSTDTLLKVGECANCSCDLYADNATAEAMHNDSYFGACIMCSTPVTYSNTGELAQIATSVEEQEPFGSEVANYFDFGELETVDPNNLKENDMSNGQARKALRASVANALSSINTLAAAEQVPSSVKSEVAAEDSDFADDADENTDDLDVMDMDDSEDEDSEDTDDAEEEASATIEQVEETPAVVTTVVVPEVAASDDDSDEDDSEDSEDEDVDDTAEDEDEDDTEEAKLAELAEATPVVSNDTPIEYLATTPALLSLDAEIVPVGETAYYVVQDNAPVAVLRKEAASVGAQSLWHKPVEIRNSYRAALSSGNREAAIAQLGASILKHTTNVAAVVAEHVTAQETAAATELATERTGLVTKMRRCLDTAALGISKGMFGAKYANPVASELAGVLAANGVHEPRAIITASMIESMPQLLELVIEKAMELSNDSEEALTATATLVGNADFQAVVETPAVVAPVAPVVEIAAVKPKSKVNVSLLTSGLGRRLHG